jgi:hypothetical protein
MREKVLHYMVIINFSHPFLREQLEQIELLVSRPVSAVHDIACQLDTDQPLAPQTSAMVAQVLLTENEWQTLPLLINLPSLNHAAALVLAELHGRMGYFPACLRLRPVTGSVPPRYEVAEILNLDGLRREARGRRKSSFTASKIEME